MSSAKKQKRQKKKDKKRHSIEQQIKSSRLSSAYNGVVKAVQSTACSVYNGTERAINTCIVTPVYWTANSLFHVTTAPLRLGFFMFDYMTCQFEEYPSQKQDPQVEETTRQLIHKLEQRVRHLEHDVKRLNRKKSLSPASPIMDSPSVQSSPSVPPPPPIFAIPAPPPPPPVFAPPPPLKFTITKKSHSTSAEKKTIPPKQNNMPAVSLQDISNVKLKRVSIAGNNKPEDGSRPEIPTLRKPLVPLRRQPPSPRGLATITMKLRKVEKSPGGTPFKLTKVVHSPKRLSTSPTLKNIKHPVNDENTPIHMNLQTVQPTSPVKQLQEIDVQPMVTV